MINKSKQQWKVGSKVNVGFVSGLLVVAMVATPGDFQPDAYLLSRNSQFYKFVPHVGLTKISDNEARAMHAEQAEQLGQAFLDIWAETQRAAAHSAVVAELMAA